MKPPSEKMPLLADLPLLRGITNVSDAVLLGRFGELTDRLTEEAVRGELLKRPEDSTSSDWKSAVGREILLAQSWGLGVPDEIWDAFASSHPFESGPNLGLFRGKRLAASAFPTDDTASSPTLPPPWCILWLSERVDGASDHSSRIEQWKDSGLPVQEYSVFLTTKPNSANTRPISQRSWTLAAHLAHRAIRDSGAREVRRRLACGWIVTGDVRDGSTINHVAVGSKVRIKAGRDWMFPPDNRPDVLGYATTLGTVRFPATLDSAWALLTNQGVVDGGTAHWPQDVEVLHSFTSGAWQPVMASLLLAASRRLVLWHSKEDVSAKPAEALKQLLKPGFWTQSPPTVQLKPVYSDEKPNIELAEVQARIRTVLENDLAGGRVVLFNVTQGNRMMAFAAHGLAQLHPNLWLVYRDLDAPPFEFTIIRYEGLLPTTETIRGHDSAQRSAVARTVPEAAWQSLFFKPSLRLPDTAETIREILGGMEIGAKIRFPAEFPRMSASSPVMSTSYLFCFAAKDLQSYIMRGGKLRDMVGATSLIDKLATQEVLEKWLTEAFEISKDKFEILQAAAGSARIRFSDKTAAEDVMRKWPLWCHAWAPDLDVVQDLLTWDASASYGKVSKAAGEALERNRNFPSPRMPEAGPFVKRAPRTGEPAVDVDYAADKELIDYASQRKRAERNALKGEMLPPVASAFGFTDADQLPNDFEQVSGGEGAYLAVIHADGNWLRQMFLEVGQALEKCDPELDETAIALFRYLSQEVVAEGTRSAVGKAMKTLPEKVRPDGKPWPFAPIVLAGDDVTVVCRADPGLPFTEAFLKAFSEEIKNRFGWLRDDQFPADQKEPDRYKSYEGIWAKLPPEVTKKIPQALSAGAGVVFCTDHYPFSLAYELCENLAKRAKVEAKERIKKRMTAYDEKDPAERPAPPSALSFVRITGASAPTEFDELADGILKGSNGTLLTGGPYFLGGNELPQYADMRAVFDAARPHMVQDPDNPERISKVGLPSTSLRGLLNLQRTKMDLVRDAVARMKEIAGGHEKPDSPRRRAWVEFEEAWKKLCGWNGAIAEIQPAPRPAHQEIATQPADRSPQADWKDLCFYDASAKANKKSSPLCDLLTLLAIRDKTEDEKFLDDRQARANSATTPAAKP